MRRYLLLLIVSAAACTHPKPPAPPPPDLHSARLAAAAAQVRAGCLDCLIAAYQEYDALRNIPPAAAEATAGIVRTAALIALRQRELGMVEDGYLARAREAAAGAVAGAVPPALVTLLDIVDATPAANVGAGRPTSDVDLDRMRQLRTNQAAWTDTLRGAAASEIAAAYTWLTFSCSSGEFRTLSRDEVLAPVAAFMGTPLIQYRMSTCRAFEEERLRGRLAVEPRFHEIDFAIGVSLMARQKLDEADAALDRAHEWHPAWPTLTLSVANIAMTAEEFDRALTMYDETLRYEPKAVDAILGKVRALTYVGKHEEAITTVDQLFAERWYVGDGRYWRAFNETQLGRQDEAWADIEIADKLLVNAEVPKLAGLIAYRRKELATSRAKFELARKRNPADCETGYYYGIVLGDLSLWAETAVAMPAAARCMQRAEEAALEEIENIRNGTEPEARKARKIAKREASIATGRRWIATAWFNTAVASYNLSRVADAREYAEKVVDDEQFGERARELISRLR